MVTESDFRRIEKHEIMSKRILILGAGSHVPVVVQKARALGLHPIAIDREGDPDVTVAPDERDSAMWLDASAIVRIAREQRVDGIYPPLEPAVAAAAQAASDLGLPGLTADAAARVCDKLSMRETLAAAHIGTTRFRGVHSVQEAEDAADAFSLPVVLKPADSSGGIGVRRVDQIEDISLAFAQAVRSSPSKVVLVESLMEGEEFCLDGFVRDGIFTVVGMMGRERSTQPVCIVTAAFAPPVSDAAACERLRRAASAALAALGIRSGWVHVDMIETTQGPEVVEVTGYPAAWRIPRDLTLLASGIDTVEACLRLSVGETPALDKREARGAAICWIPTRSGIVREIWGLDEARAVPGVEEVTVFASPGQIMGHVVDCASRDRVGYVVATGPTAAAALAAAAQARDLCRVLTSPAYD